MTKIRVGEIGLIKTALAKIDIVGLTLFDDNFIEDKPKNEQSFKMDCLKEKGAAKDKRDHAARVQSIPTNLHSSNSTPLN